MFCEYVLWSPGIEIPTQPLTEEKPKKSRAVDGKKKKKNVVVMQSVVEPVSIEPDEPVPEEPKEAVSDDDSFFASSGDEKTVGLPETEATVEPIGKSVPMHVCLLPNSYCYFGRIAEETFNCS